VSASAGSGKTAVLVERVINLIMNDKNSVNIDEILMCTFTKMAVSEMREKIINKMSEMLTKDPHNKFLQKQIILVQYADICTVHSFCKKLIKENAIKLEIHSNFLVASESIIKDIKQKVVNKVLIEGYKGNSNDEFLTLVDNYGGKFTDQELEKLIINLYDFARNTINPEEWLKCQIRQANLLNINNLGNLEYLKNYINNYWGKVYSEQIKQEIQSHIYNYKNAIKVIYDDNNFFPYKLNFDIELEFLNGLSVLCEKMDFAGMYSLINNFKFDKLKPKNKNASQEKSIYLQNTRNATKYTIKTLQKTVFYDNLQDLCWPIMKTANYIINLCNLTLEFDKLYNKRKRELNILDFEDLEHLTIKLLNNENFCAEISKKYKFVLVDEYQDINFTQSYIFEKIANNHNLFMVGDIKQSIYRFRNANPEIFLEKYYSYPEKIEQNGNRQNSNKDNKKIILADNFRSSSNIINFVNCIFKNVMSKYVGDIDYCQNEKLLASCDKNYDNKTKVELHIIQKVNSYNDTNFEDQFEIKTTNITEARLLAQRIYKLVNQEKPFIFDKKLSKNRLIKYSDITILCRKTKGISEILVSELRRYKIPVQGNTNTSNSLDFHEIKLIIFLLKIIDNPLQDIELISVLRSPLFEFDEQDLAKVRINTSKFYFFESIKEFINNESTAKKFENTYKKCQIFIESINRYHFLSLEVKLKNLIEKICDDTQFDIYLSSRENAIELMNALQKLKDYAEKFETVEYRGIYEFVNQLNIASLQDNSDLIFLSNQTEDNNLSNYVNIMSIHKSKGLEFSVVILFGSGWKFNEQDLSNKTLFDFNLGIAMDYVDIMKSIKIRTLSKSAIEFKKRLEMLSEEMRLLYVALTRARDILIVLGTVTNIENRKIKWNSCYFDEKVLPSYVSKQTCFIDWIGPAVFNSIDWLKNSLEIYEHEDINQTLLKDSIELVNYEESQENSVNNMDSSIKHAHHQFFYKYRYIESTKIPSKLSVSEVLRLSDNSNSNKFKLSSLCLTNRNINKAEHFKISSRFYGIIMHFIMQKIDISRTNSLIEINNQIEEWTIAKIIDRRIINKINPQKILDFFSSDLGNRLKKSQNVVRERRFFIEMSPQELDLKIDLFRNSGENFLLENFLQIKKEGYGNTGNFYDDGLRETHCKSVSTGSEQSLINCFEKILIQGVIDCYFEEDGNIIVIDYKTGKDTTNNKKQLEIYSKALSKIINLPVTESYICEI